MIKDTTLSTELTFAILPIFMPINPRTGKVVKATRKAEDTTEDEMEKNKKLEREIDPWKKHTIKEKLNVSVLENEIIGSFNNSGYYIFLNLPRPDLPQRKGYTLSIESDSFLSSRNFIDTDQFTSNKSNKSIAAFLFEKKLLKNTDKGSRFINSIIIYPSKKTILKLIINKVKSESSENGFEKPIRNAKVHLKKSHLRNSSRSQVDLTPNSVSSNDYDFSSFDELEQIETLEGTYDESYNSTLGVRNFIKFPDQNEAKFLLTIQLEGESEDTADKHPLEIKIEKAMTTSINVLILD